MIPTLVVLLGTFAIFAIERVRGRKVDATHRAGRIALAVFFFAGVSHFIFPVPMGEMVPPPFPVEAMVALSGVLEILGAIGLEPRGDLILVFSSEPTC